MPAVPSVEALSTTITSPAQASPRTHSPMFAASFRVGMTQVSRGGVVMTFNSMLTGPSAREQSPPRERLVIDRLSALGRALDREIGPHELASRSREAAGKIPVTEQRV